MLQTSHQNLQGVYSFWAQDSHERYLANLAEQPPDWWYRTHTVTYRVNSEGYRAPEFAGQAWGDTVVLLGDELAWGVGLDEADTLARKLSIHLERPVINLSQPGAGSEWIWAQCLDLVAVKPWALVVFWPDPLRWCSWAHTLPQHHGHWTENPPPDQERRTRSWRSQRAVSQMPWNRYASWTITRKWAHFYSAEHPQDSLVDLDRSRCGSIPGRASIDLISRAAARTIA
jgi:hypothetical protein